MEYKFVREPDDVLKCAICLEVARNPHQHEECGKLFCKECIDKYGKDKPCPHCRIHSQYFRDNKSSREIQGILVRCDNDERGCTWEGTLGALGKHVATCGFTLVPCPQECEDENGAVKSLLKKDMASHLEQDCPNRDYECEHCGEEGTYQHITEIHDNVCNKKIIPCPNVGCCEHKPREELDGHENKCEHAIVSCKYKNVGCEVKMERRNMVAHEQDDSIHTHMTLGAVVEVRSAMVGLQSTVDDLEERLEDAEGMCVDSRWPSKTFALPGIQGKREGNESFTSPSFYTSRNGYKLRLKVYVNGRDNAMGTHVSVFVSPLKGQGHLEAPSGKVVITLLNQLTDEHHHTKTFKISERSGMRKGVRTYAPHSILAFDSDTQYLMDDTLYFRVSFQEKSGKPWLNCN